MPENEPHVLVVDDDLACLEEYVNTLSELGFRCRSTTSPNESLNIIANDSRISILLTDIRMPEINGIELFRLCMGRIAGKRTIVPIFITAYADIDVAVEALRLEAADFLRKPVTRSELAMAMARAQSTVAAKKNSPEELLMIQESDLMNQLIGQLRQARQSSTKVEPTEGLSLEKEIKSYISNRQQRSRYFPEFALCDTSWNILLDLALAYIQNKPVPVSSACIASEAPISTALRRIRELCDAGLIIRWPDPNDGRRDLVRLSEACFQSIEAFFYDKPNKLRA